MRRIGLPLLTAIVAAVCSAFGQPAADCPKLSGTSSTAQTLHVQSSDFTGASVLQVQHIQLFSETGRDVTHWSPPPVEGIVRALPEPMLPQMSPLTPPRTVENAANRNTARNTADSGLLLASAPVPETDSASQNNVTFASPVVSGDRANIAFDAAPTSPPPTNRLPVFQPQTVVANNMPTSAPAVTARPVAQNAVTKNHLLRQPAQVFERNLMEKLGSRFVPVRNVTESSGIAQYRLPVKDGTDIELVINRQQGIVSVTGSPGMVDTSLQIVRILDAEEAVGGPVARFVPVQQSNVGAARQVADIVNRETLRAAQVNRPAVAGPLPIGLDEDALTTAGVVGPVQIEIIDALGTVMIQGTPEDVRIVQGMLQQLEALSLENEPIIELIPMRHADSLRVSQLVLSLYQQVYQVRRGVIIMQPLVKPNTILVIGRQESIEAAKELIAKLDTPAIPNASFRIFHLKHSDATTMANQVSQSFQNRPGFGQGLSLQLNITADFRTNALIVQANPRDMREVETMIRQLDAPGSETTTIVRRFPLRNMTATDMQQVLTNALSQSVGTRGTMLSLGRIDAAGNLIRSSVSYNVAIVADTRGNSLIVTAPPETMPLLAALIEELDQLPAAESRIRVFTLANGNAFDLTQLLTNLFGTATAATGTGAGQIASVRPGFEEGESTLVGVRFQADVRTNSIVAIGSEADLINAEALLLRLDAENLNNRTVFTMKLINTPADEIAPILNSYFTTERQFNIQNSASFLPNSPIEQFRMETNVIAEPASNSLIISTTPRYYEEVRRIILAIDERPLMVAIDVLIAEVDITRNKDRGVEFGLQDSILFGGGVPSNPLGALTSNTPFFRSGAGTVGTQGITSLGVPNSGVGGFSFAASSESVSIFIRALETHGKTQVLSRPRLVTLHNRSASVMVGENVPYPGGTTMNANTSSTQVLWEEVGTILDITPRIMPDGMVAMAVYVVRSSLGTERRVGDSDVPSIKTTNAQTTVNAMDGQSVIFAGLITEHKTSINNSIPGLNKIPVIKHLFEYDQRRYERTELVIILTPRIIRTPEDMMILNQQERERMQWCVSDVVKLTGDSSIRRRSDVWYPSEVRHTHGSPAILHETQLPPDNRIPTPMLPVIETK